MYNFVETAATEKNLGFIGLFKRQSKCSISLRPAKHRLVCLVKRSICLGTRWSKIGDEAEAGRCSISEERVLLKALNCHRSKKSRCLLRAKTLNNGTAFFFK